MRPPHPSTRFVPRQVSETLRRGWSRGARCGRESTGETTAVKRASLMEREFLRNRTPRSAGLAKNYRGSGAVGSRLGRHDFLSVAARRNARASIVHRRGGARHRSAPCVLARRPLDPRRHVAHDTCAFNACVRFGRSTFAINFRRVARARRFATAWLRGAQRFEGA